MISSDFAVSYDDFASRSLARWRPLGHARWIMPRSLALAPSEQCCAPMWRMAGFQTGIALMTLGFSRRKTSSRRNDQSSQMGEVSGPIRDITGVVTSPSLKMRQGVKQHERLVVPLTTSHCARARWLYSWRFATPGTRSLSSNRLHVAFAQPMGSALQCFSSPLLSSPLLSRQGEANKRLISCSQTGKIVVG